MKIEQHITVKAMAERLAVNPQTIHRLINDYKLTAVKLGRKWCIPESSAAAYIASRTVYAKKR